MILLHPLCREEKQSGYRTIHHQFLGQHFKEEKGG